MKKFFTLIAMAFMAGVSFADEVDLTLTEGHTLLVSTIEAAGGTDTDIVRFYIVNEKWDETAVEEGADGPYNPTSREGWGIGGFANSDNWSPTESWTGQAGGSWTYEYTVAQIKEVAGDTPGEWHGIGITINIYNDCKVDKVTLEPSGSVEPIEPAGQEDILPNFSYTWNSEESIEKQADGSVIFNAVSWGGLAYWLGGVDWSNYEKLVVEYAEPTPVLTQIKIQGCEPEMEAQAPAGSTTLEAPFEGFDMTAVSQVALQAAEAGVIHIARIYLVPKSAAGIDSVKTTQTENGAIYNLAGQRVDASYRGVVIMNGKKFIQK